MAVDKAKVIAALEVKFKGKNLTKTYKEKLAERWAPKIETDDDIEAYVSDREDVILETVAEADRRATQATKSAREDAARAAAGEEAPTQNEPAAPAVPEGTPDYMKQFMQQMTTQMGTLTQTVTGLQQARTAESIADRFKKDDRLKGIPEALLHGRYPEKEEDFETAIEAAATVLKPYVNAKAAESFGNDSPGGTGKAATAAADSGKVNPAVLAFAKQQTESFTKQNSSS